VARRLLGPHRRRRDPSEPASFERCGNKLEGEERSRATAATGCLSGTPPDALRRSRANSPRRLLRQDDGYGRGGGRETFGHRSRNRLGAQRRTTEGRLRTPELRIDHYLGKRRCRTFWCALRQRHVRADWNRNPIDHVQITVDETLASAIAAALRLNRRVRYCAEPPIQLLSLVAMEPPARFDAHTCAPARPRCCRDQTQSDADALQNSVRGHYRPPIQIRPWRNRKTPHDIAPDSPPKPMSRSARSITALGRLAVLPRTGKTLGAKRTRVASSSRKRVRDVPRPR